MKEKIRKDKFSRNKKAFIFLLILCLGIGFAFLTSNLTITGNTSVSGNKWSVYFNNVQITEGSVEATVEPTTTGTTTTSIEYTVLLDKPGDFYEFTVEAKNDGTIDAAIETLTTPNITSRVRQYINYSATYLDGTPVREGDILKKKSSNTYKIRIDYRTDIVASDLDEEGVNLDLAFGINYIQYTPVPSKFAKLVKSSALSDSSINFGAISSSSNGQGLYVMESTKNDNYPIYYYRGNVSNNNAKFAGFCWKIVRTTETGGTKLIYNGLPDGNGQCTNITGDATQLSSTTEFNPNLNSPAYSGYMYGTVYSYQTASTSSSQIYGNSFAYNDGIYTLRDTQSGVDSMHHYTCLSSSTTCESVKYIYSVSDSTAYYITLTGGKSVEDALVEMQTNTNNSTVKTAVDNWFNNTFKTYFTSNNEDYNNYLEDTIWCNDRSMNTLEVEIPSWEGTSMVNNGWKPNGGGLDNYLYYSGHGRRENGVPSLTCSNKNDSFTVNETLNGNGALTYPVGLLTSDEVILAGGQAAVNTSFYLYNNKIWWFLSPVNCWGNNTRHFNMSADGYMDNHRTVDQSLGIRPSISLKPNVKIASGGDGSSATPYEFIVE